MAKSEENKSEKIAPEITLKDVLRKFKGIVKHREVDNIRDLKVDFIDQLFFQEFEKYSKLGLLSKRKDFLGFLELQTRYYQENKHNNNGRKVKFFAEGSNFILEVKEPILRLSEKHKYTDPEAGTWEENWLFEEHQKHSFTLNSDGLVIGFYYEEKLVHKSQTADGKKIEEERLIENINLDSNFNPEKKTRITTFRIEENSFIYKDSYTNTVKELFEYNYTKLIGKDIKVIEKMG